MVGERLGIMERGVQTVIKDLRTDPHALETVFVSVIAFAGIAKNIASMVELASFYPPKLPLGSGTDLAAGLYELMASMDRSVMKTTADRKGDWKPLVYLLTDGRPTSDSRQAIDRWKREFAGRATLVAVGIGAGADLQVLRALTDNVFSLSATSEGDFRRFFNWVTASVSMHSKSLEVGDEGGAVRNVDSTILSLIKNAPVQAAADSTVTFVGRCQATKRPYIIRYDKGIGSKLETRDLSLDIARYELSGCYPLEEDYFGWSQPRPSDVEVNTSELMGSPSCPHCGNETAFAVCGCGKLLCINGVGDAKCPWCEKMLHFSPVSGEAGGLDVTMGAG